MDYQNLKLFDKLYKYNPHLILLRELMFPKVLHSRKLPFTEQTNPSAPINNFKRRERKRKRTHKNILV
jgi:hypothetical protein